jgi:hypothetical protein
MKKLISHRGNIAGPQPELENTPAYVLNALKRGFECEVDLWHHNKEWFLGHEGPETKIDLDFVMRDDIWVHAKDLGTMAELIKIDSHLINFFYHTVEDAVMTSRGYLWTYPGKPLTHYSIAVKPENIEGEWPNIGACDGICSDWIGKYIND